MGSLSRRLLPHGRGIWQAPGSGPKATSLFLFASPVTAAPRPLAPHMLVNDSSDTFSLLGFLSESAKSKSKQQHY